MWFTIAFFTYPIALFLTYKVFKNFKTNGLRNLLLASLIFTIPIILLIIEQNNLDEIESDLIGKYVSDNDTLIIHDKEYIYINKKNETFGLWELLTNDNLSIRLTDNQNKKMELKINYSDGQPVLNSEVTTYTKIK